MTLGGATLLKTRMGAGHGGSSGRFDRLREIAEHYFALACCGTTWALDHLIPRFGDRVVTPSPR